MSPHHEKPGRPVWSAPADRPAYGPAYRFRARLHEFADALGEGNWIGRQNALDEQRLIVEQAGVQR